jgi:hypothetical protein
MFYSEGQRWRLGALLEPFIAAKDTEPPRQRLPARDRIYCAAL